MTRPKLHLPTASMLAALVVLYAGSAHALTPAEQRCFGEINNGARKVLLSENREIGTCIKLFVKGKLFGQTVVQCGTPPLASKVQKQIDKALANSSKRCNGAPPAFGPPSITAPPGHAVDNGFDLLADLFGNDVDGALFLDTQGAACQGNVHKAAWRCADTRIKEFAKCKSGGLRNGAIIDAATLESECLGTGPEQPDPKDKIRIACQAKILSAAARCVAKGVTLAAAFPNSGAVTDADLMSYLDGRTRCHACELANAVDGLAKDCDVADDGNDANNSCDEPTTCGDLFVDGTENCEDGNANSGDGCSSACQVETGWNCAGLPAACDEICGDGLIVGAESCDDGGTANGDGCSSTCQTENGYACSGQPSTCDEVCGDGLIVGAEQCDDDNAAGGDGCSATCTIEPGFACSGTPSICDVFGVTITSPAHASFTTAANVAVTGVVSELSPALAALTINGNPVAVQLDGTFSTVVALSPSAIFNPIFATVVDTVHGGIAHDRVVVHWGQSVADGAFSTQTIALRLNDTGLDEVEPLVAELAGGGLDLADLVPVGTVLVNNECFITDPIFGSCLGRATVKIANPPPSFSSFGLAIDSMTNFVAGDVTVSNIDVHVQLDGSGLVPSCPIQITASQAFFFGDYDLSPDPVIPANIDVNQVGSLEVSFSNFQTHYGGICDVAIIGDIIQAFLPNVESLTIDALKNFLNDPDGAGPQDGPIADAIESALAGVSIAGPIGSALGVNLETPLFAVTEDTAGVTLDSDTRVTKVVGPGEGQCIPPVGAPELTASLAFTEPFPVFGANTPVGGVPYDLAIAISAEAFNQLLKAQTECGLLVTSLTEIDIGLGPLPLTAGLLSVLVPEFAAFPPTTPFRIDIRPTLAPIVTGQAGPSGEITELRVANVLANLVANDGSELVGLSVAFDASLGMNLAFLPGALAIDLTPPLPGSILVEVVRNPLGVNEANLATNVLPPLLESLLPDLAGALSSFPLPEFFGLNLTGIEVTRVGQFMSVYTDLSPAP
jgi:cysteine-rich repeat protein